MDRINIAHSGSGGIAERFAVGLYCLSSRLQRLFLSIQLAQLITETGEERGEARLKFGGVVLSRPAANVYRLLHHMQRFFLSAYQIQSTGEVFEGGHKIRLKFDRVSQGEGAIDFCDTLQPVER